MTAVPLCSKAGQPPQSHQLFLLNSIKNLVDRAVQEGVRVSVDTLHLKMQGPQLVGDITVAPFILFFFFLFLLLLFFYNDK